MILRIFLLVSIFNLFPIMGFSQDPHWEQVDFPYHLENWRLGAYNDSLTGDYYLYGKYENLSGSNYCRYKLTKFDGEVFDEIGNFNEVINEVVRFNENIYVGGSFSCVDSMWNIQYLAKYENEIWQPVAELNGSVTALITDDTYLYVAGSFTEINGLPIANMARYDGENWEPVGGNALGDNTWIWSLCFFQGELYAAGDLDLDNAPDTEGLRVLRNNEWVLVDELNLIGHARVVEMVVWQEKLYLAGRFFFYNNPLHTSLIVWDGIEFSAPYPKFYDIYHNIGYGSQVRRLIATNDYLYVAGSLEYIGDQEVNQLAAYNGETWCAMFTEGLEYAIQAIFEIDNELYAYLYLNPYSNTIYPSAMFKWIGGNDYENCQTYTGVNEVSTKNLNIYPIPAVSIVTVSGDFIGKIVYSLFNSQGKMVDQKEMPVDGSFKIDCSKFSSGTYFLQVLNRERFYKTKIIIL
ncbi:T9SS type A sorting domain-containing protein [Cryomorpha ignava]|uniref:T9SS type A sorting domain-containing protein n=1 Tax=Cryomorpha ignava TaxID=101383 RepID=A0A7K3WU40_9FLAO|nr:T9SS type A sorting domain-containing protein [Cryomorpha ignava]NEN25068.1 T9SS type A sorting domain-containing protein [Cryomorpha ignava]